MAGIAAKQLAQPVGATAGGTNGGALIIGANSVPGNTPNTYTDTTTLRPTSGTTVPGTFSTGGTALFGIGQDNQEGLIGVRYGPADFGVEGVTDSGIGVVGVANSGAATTSNGVFDQSNATARYGVYGTTGGAAGTGVRGNGGGASGTGVADTGDAAGAIGVKGASTSGTGVKGTSATGFPVIGQVTGATNATPAVYGTGTAGPGVQGQSTGGHGLVGFTASAAGYAGLIGYASAAGGIGLRGSGPGGAFGGGLAGVFDGDVAINGALRVYGSPKSAAVRHPDGSHRLLYCMESPESWFEDFGEGKLVNGKAEVKLDGDFAALVHSDDYHVFLTAHDAACKGLAVTAHRPDGFTVQELGGGASGGTFAYRVVAKRKDIKGERLAKVAPPPALKAPATFTVPETPALTVPEPPKKL